MSDNLQYALDSEPVRCRVCGTTVSTALTVCPTCGNDIRPQRRSYLNWGGMLLLVGILLLAALIGLPGTDNGLRQLVRASLTRLDQLATDYDPRLAATLTPEGAAVSLSVPQIKEQSAATATFPPLESTPQGAAILLVATATMSDSADLTLIISPTATSQATATSVATDTLVPTETEAATATEAGTETATPTLTPEATETPLPTATATTAATRRATPRVSALSATATQTADASKFAASTPISETALVTATEIALDAASVISSSEIVTDSDIIASDVLSDSAVISDSSAIEASDTVSDVLSLLAPTETPIPVPVTPTPSDTATPANLIYVVRTGDTLVSIAARYNVTLDDLMLANGYGKGRASVIRPGQKLVIPLPQVNEVAQANTDTPTATEPAATATLEPSPTATTPPPTALPAPLTYVVKSGDTPMSIARRFGVSVNELLAANGLTLDDATRIRVGQTLQIPGVQAPAQSAVAEATAVPQQTYVVQSGDTPGAIAARYGVSLNALLAANGLTRSDATRIRVGQVLIIPGVAAATPTATRNGETSAPTPTTAASTGQTQSVIRLDAPLLRSPENGTTVSCSVPNRLIWEPVPFILDTDNYLVHLGYISGTDGAGSPIVTWILEQVRPATDTLWNLDTNLCAYTPAGFDRQWRWYVEVIDTTAGNTVVSAPGPVYAFRWE
ncbi:MAG: LysM peptidoglycan-binding domain-containing protein [Caldilineaceae bacterium]